MNKRIGMTMIWAGIAGFFGGIVIFGALLHYPTPKEHSELIYSVRLTDGESALSFKIPPIPAADRCRAVILFDYETDTYEKNLALMPYYSIRTRLVVGGPGEAIAYDRTFDLTWGNSTEFLPEEPGIRAENNGSGTQSRLQGKGRHRAKPFKVPANTELSATFSFPDPSVSPSDTIGGSQYNIGHARNVEIQILRGQVDEGYYQELRASGPSYGLAITGIGIASLILGIILRVKN
jgi:hypothetical protein